MNPIDHANLIRDLVTRREGTRLDFKRLGYDLAGDGRFELAKDLIAMANALPAGTENAYILVGVEEAPDKTGRIVGVPRPSHPDDANLHLAVRHLLNRTPDFSYCAVDVEGSSVGMFEIRPGGRPFFFASEKGKLVRHQALVRDGSSTDVASPTQILEWAKEDDSEARELRALDLQAARAKTAVRPALLPGSTSNSGNYIEFHGFVENRGECPFTVCNSGCTYVLRDDFRAQVHVAVPAILGELMVIGSSFLQPGENRELVARLTKEDLARHGITAPVPLYWFEARFGITCEGTTGERQEARLTRRFK